MEKENKPHKETRPASTVILVRESEAEKELQVYLLKRSGKSGFFPGNYVFPGGTLDPDEEDTIFWQDHLDLSGRELIERFGPGLTNEDLMAYGVAAIRETLEEAGIFLAWKKMEGIGSSEIFCERPSPEAQVSGWFREKVLQEGWRLSFSRLFPWSHWITPEAMPKRFDTRFFVASMPEGQHCKPDERETTHGLWISPRKALEANGKGEIPLSPPTLVTLHSLLSFGSIEGLTRAATSHSWGEPILPILLMSERERVLIEPWDPDYGQVPELGPGDLKDMVLPVGESFSRLWMQDGIWRPIKIG
jgi:8-oxo-dGTP pyrophosphatase MutT (NUDIX family)